MTSVAPRTRGDGIRRRVITKTRADGSQYSIELFVGEVVMGHDPLTGKPVRRSFSAGTRADAGRAKRALLAERDRHRRPTSARFTVAGYLRHWLDTVIAIPTDFDPATFASYDRTFRAHIESTHLGGRPLKGPGRVEPADVDRWKAALATTPAAHTGRPLAPSTRRRCLTVLRKGLGHAFRQGYIDQNVAAKDFVDGVKVPKRPIRPLSRPQMLRLLARAREEGDPDYAMYVLVCWRSPLACARASCWACAGPMTSLSPVSTWSAARCASWCSSSAGSSTSPSSAIAGATCRSTPTWSRCCASTTRDYSSSS
jgi:hypothetical protein